MSYNIANTGFKVGAADPYLVGGVDVALADGGTGASDAAGARSNLGLGSMATQAASAVAITGGTMDGVAITGLPAPVNDNDAVRKTDLFSVASGLSYKSAVRTASDAALPAYTRTGNVLDANANGAIGTQDGIAPASNDRFLLKNGAAPEDNGIYTWTALGGASAKWQLTRAKDADVSAEVTSGMTCWVNEGTKFADTGFTLITDGTITLNTTGLTFTQTSGLGQVVAGNGLSKTGNTISVLLDGTTLAASGSGVKVNTNGITSNEINGGAVTLAKLARPAMGAFIIGQGAGADAQAFALSGDATTDGTGVVTIAANAIGSSKIAGNAVTQAKMAANSVGSGEIIDGSVGNAELANAAVTPAKADLSQAWTHTGSLIANGGMYLKTAVSTTNVTIDAVTTVMAITDTSAARTVTLPAVSGNNGRILVIKDATGAAATNNITIDANASETIDGQLTKLINTNYGSVTLVGDPSGWFVV